MALAARPTLSPPDALHATPLKLTAVDTMRGPRLRYDVVSRLFGFIDLVYGRAGSLRKF